MSDPSYPSTSRAETRSTSSERSSASVNVIESRIADRGDRDRTSAGQDGRGVLDRVKQSATTQLTQQKERGVEALASVAQAVRSSTQGLRAEKHDSIARYVD